MDNKPALFTGGINLNKMSQRLSKYMFDLKDRLEIRFLKLDAYFVAGHKDDLESKRISKTM